MLKKFYRWMGWHWWKYVQYKDNHYIQCTTCGQGDRLRGNYSHVPERFNRTVCTGEFNTLGAKQFERDSKRCW